MGTPSRGRPVGGDSDQCVWAPPAIPLRAPRLFHAGTGTPSCCRLAGPTRRPHLANLLSGVNKSKYYPG